MSPELAALDAIDEGCGDLLVTLLFGPMYWSEIARDGLVSQAETAGRLGLVASAPARRGEDLEVTLTARGQAVLTVLRPHPMAVAS